MLMKYWLPQLTYIYMAQVYMLYIGGGQTEIEVASHRASGGECESVPDFSCA